MYNLVKKFLIIFITLNLFISINFVNAEKINPNNSNEFNDSIDINKYFNLNDFYYRLFYVGKIENLERRDNFISFNSVNLFRISFIRSSDLNFWEYSISHYEDTYHQHENYRFFGILTNNFIIGILFK